MDLEKVTAIIRPRKSWEAIDLGVALAQRHGRELYKIWFIITLPAFLLISILFAENAVWGYFLFWWLKPLWERPLLHLLSRELFGESLDVKSCVKQFFSLAKIQWFASLTWRRLSFTRSMDLPIIQLEGLAGSARSNRLKVIHSFGAGAAVWLTILFFLSEVIFSFAILALAFLLLPVSMVDSIEPFEWFFSESKSLFGDFVINLVSYLAMSLIAPFFIACGFALYLNQRTHLEAWDIELAFKRLAKRLTLKSDNQLVKLASFLPLVLMLSFSFSPELRATEVEVEAQTLAEKIQEATEDKLSQQTLTEASPHQQAKKLIAKIKQGEEFHQQETRHRLVPVNERDAIEDEAEYSDSFGVYFWQALAKFIAFIAEFALWVFVALFIIFLIIKYRHLITGIRPNTKIKHARPKKLFGLDIQAENLPDKPWQVARNLLEQGEYRQALSLLYRASLVTYIDNTHVVIREGDTELECLDKITPFTEAADKQFMQQLTKIWRQLAYAHLTPAKEEVAQLCDDWPLVLKRLQTPEASNG